MKLRRVVAALGVAAVMSTLVSSCTSTPESGEFSKTNSKTGVVVEGPERALDGDLTIEEVTNSPEMPSQLDRVGPVTHLQAKLEDSVKVTLPAPKSYKGDMNDLWIMKREANSKTWLPLIPQEIDSEKRTVSITTRTFSFWTLGTWKAEEAAAQMAADLRNLTSTDGAWVISDAARLTGNAPVTECRYPALTLKLDVTKFIKGAILCPKFVAEGKDAKGRTTYDLHISNIQTYPVKLWLNSGVTFKKVAPAPNNPIHQVFQTTVQSQRAVTLPGAGELVLTVRGDKIPAGGVKISGYLDFSTLMVDLAFASIETITGFDAKERFTRLKNSSAAAAYAACVTAGSKNLAQQFQQDKQGGVGEFAGKIFGEALSCLKGDILEELLKDYYRNRGFLMTDKEMEKWLKKLPIRILTVLKNAPVLVSLASAVATVKYERSTYLLNIIDNDPATDELYKALPTPGKGGFEPAQGADAGPANGGQLTYIGTPCMAKNQAQPWGTWSLASAHAQYMRGDIDVTIRTAYVRQEYKEVVQALFAGAVNDRSKCDLQEDDTLTFLEKHDGRKYGNLTDYRLGTLGWVDSEYMVYGVVSVYDPVKGVVMQITAFADPYSGVTPEEIKAELPLALDYAANKLDVSVGTTYTFG